MIPKFLPNGNLPKGMHKTTWKQFCKRFGHTDHRSSLIEGLAVTLKDLSAAGCRRVYINGSFVTAKMVPGVMIFAGALKELTRKNWTRYFWISALKVDRQ